MRQGSRLAFTEVVDTVYRFDAAEVVLSLGADFLFYGPASVRYAHDFAGKRRVNGPGAEMGVAMIVSDNILDGSRLQRSFLCVSNKGRVC